MDLLQKVDYADSLRALNAGDNSPIKKVAAQQPANIKQLFNLFTHGLISTKNAALFTSHKKEIFAHLLEKFSMLPFNCW